MATAKNDVTGDSLKTKPTSELYSNNYDNIFRKKTKEPTTQPTNHCPCGGAPSRYCWCPDKSLLDSPEVTSDKPMEPT